MIGAWLIVPTDAQGLGTDWNPAVGILVVLAIGAAVGLFNGFMIVKLRFNAFIFTLAMLILLAGLQQGIVSGRTIYGMPHSYIYLGSAYWGGFPVSAWTMLAVFVVAGLFLRYHRTGRRQPGEQPDLHGVRRRRHRRHRARGRSRPDDRRVHGRRPSRRRQQRARAAEHVDVLDRRRERSDHPDRARARPPRRERQAVTGADCASQAVVRLRSTSSSVSAHSRDRA
jgi:hypothetical protein